MSLGGKVRRPKTNHLYKKMRKGEFVRLRFGTLAMCGGGGKLRRTKHSRGSQRTAGCREKTGIILMINIRAQPKPPQPPNTLSNVVKTERQKRQKWFHVSLR